MDINKIFLSSTIAESINDIVNSNTTSVNSKINNLNTLLNEYETDLSNDQSIYQNGLTEMESDDPTFNRMDWEVLAPKLIDAINKYQVAISTINADINKLDHSLSKKENHDRIIDDVVDASPLAMVAWQKIKKFYDKHRTNSDSKGDITDGDGHSVDRVDSPKDGNGGPNDDNTSDGDDFTTDRDLPVDRGSLINTADEHELMTDFRTSDNTLNNLVDQMTDGLNNAAEQVWNKPTAWQGLEEFFGRSGDSISEEDAKDYLKSHRSLLDKIEDLDSYEKDIGHELDSSYNRGLGDMELVDEGDSIVDDALNSANDIYSDYDVDVESPFDYSSVDNFSEIDDAVGDTEDAAEIAGEVIADIFEFIPK